MAVTWAHWTDAISKAVKGVPDEILLTAAKLIKGARLVLTAGNGGSHALASHAAQAFMKPAYKAGGGVATVCLSDAVPTLTAHVNDAGWSTALEEVARPFLNNRHTEMCRHTAIEGGAFNCRAMCGSIALVVFSSSGKSENIVRLANLFFGCDLIAFTGFDGGPLRQILTKHPYNGVSIHVDSTDYEVVEPAHDALLHRVQYHLRTLV
jgi:phosphoheptose isomerase